MLIALSEYSETYFTNSCTSFSGHATLSSSDIDSKSCYGCVQESIHSGSCWWLKLWAATCSSIYGDGTLSRFALYKNIFLY